MKVIQQSSGGPSSGDSVSLIKIPEGTVLEVDGMDGRANILLSRAELRTLAKALLKAAR